VSSGFSFVCSVGRLKILFAPATGDE
jgi:hypothetical protein